MKKENVQVLPVLAREGMVPSERARFSRPGREEEEVRRGERKRCWFVRCSTLGGVGMNTEGETGGYGRPISALFGKAATEFSERYLRTRRTTEALKQRSNVATSKSGAVV